MPEKTRKVLHIIDTLDRGGAEQLLVNVVRNLPQFEHFVVYLCKPDPLVAELPPQTHVIHLDFRNRFSYLTCTLKLRKLIRNEKIRVIHTHQHASTMIARMAAGKNCRVITTLHSMPVKRNFLGRQKFWISRKVTYKRDKHFIIAVSREVMDSYQHVMKYTAGLILPNFIGDHFFADQPKQYRGKGTLRMIAVGNLRPVKNHFLLLEALRYCNGNIELDICGEGSEHDALQAYIDQYRLPVRLLGKQEDIHRLLPQYDLYVSSSISEGHPLSVLEAMAAGLPVLAPDISVFREATGGQALFFEQGNPQLLAQKLTEQIAGNANLLNAVAQSCHTFMQQNALKAGHLEALHRLYTGRLELKGIHGSGAALIMSLAQFIQSDFMQSAG